MSQNQTRLLVLDTNVLIAAARAPSSASRRIVEACLEGHQWQAATSGPVNREYEFIMSRALRGADYVSRLEALIEQAVCVEADPGPHHVPDDPDDAKLLATAVAARATALITNDRHLLVCDPYQGVRIMRPAAFAQTHLPPH